MNAPAYVEEELALDCAGMTRTALVRTPRRLTQPAGLLINLAVDRRQSLDNEWFDIVPNIFLAAGHRVASFDLPRHGELAEAGVEGLTAMAQAARRGQDVFAEIRRVGTALIETCIARGLAEAGRILLAGTSRGGLAALHVMAAEPRVLAAAAFWPVTHLPTLTEFHELQDHPIVRAGNAEALVGQLADRPVFLAIAAEDPRVGAPQCLGFHAALSAASRSVRAVLFCAQGQSHGDTCRLAGGYQAGAAFLLQQLAHTMKHPLEAP